jgi:hypothetical protein
MQNCWNEKVKNKAKDWKPMVVEIGNTCSKSKGKTKLASEVFISIFIDQVRKVTKGSLVIAKGEKVGTLYLYTGNTDSYIYLSST